MYILTVPDKHPVRSRQGACSSYLTFCNGFGCAAWHPNLKKKYKNKLQVLQNKCILFCLQLDNIEHIGTKHFDKISWFPIHQRFKQCLSTSAFKFFFEVCPQSMNEIYQTTNQKNTVTRNSSLKLFQPQMFVVFRAFYLEWFTKWC